MWVRERPRGRDDVGEGAAQGEGCVGEGAAQGEGCVGKGEGGADLGVRRLDLLAVALQLVGDFQPDLFGFGHRALCVGNHVVLSVQPGGAGTGCEISRV